MNYVLEAVKLNSKENKLHYGLFLTDNHITYLLNLDLKTFEVFSNVSNNYTNFEKKALVLNEEDLYELKMNLLEYLQLYTSRNYLSQQVDLIVNTLKKSKKLSPTYKTESFLDLLRKADVKNKLVQKFLNETINGERNGSKLKRKINDLNAKNELLTSDSIYKKIETIVLKSFK